MHYTNQAKDLFNPGTDLTAAASAPVAGKTFVTISGAPTRGLFQVATATPGTTALGVAKYDAATGDLVGIARGHRIITVTAGEALPAGTTVQVGTNGQAVALTDGTPVGITMDTAAAGTDCYIALR
ncbi:hypothetical protein Csp1_25660 [Corynebacterium provencense]|uniref:DUF2190 domain-containing protein n=1 Tax=Corynebacterium provencense TaxID=1737425 RepID=A0A2Z3YXQ8_9CORY|nr:capsid cement protein [Corynebacterium provencense]AWT27314.1 hypothetical protein Csp1_25660 [Corynebacterium provencense]